MLVCVHTSKEPPAVCVSVCVADINLIFLSGLMQHNVAQSGMTFMQDTPVSSI